MKKPTSYPRFALATQISKVAAIALVAATSLMATTTTVMASSHSDAPLIKLDPQANLTDVYTFVRTRASGERVLVVEVSVRPFSEPGDGVMYEAFSDDARYSIHIANPVTGAELLPGSTTSAVVLGGTTMVSSICSPWIRQAHSAIP